MELDVHSCILLAHFFQKYFIQYCFICRPSESTVSEDAGIEPRTYHSAKSHPDNYIFEGKAICLFLFLIIEKKRLLTVPFLHES
jgi:hypothetical protein